MATPAPDNKLQRLWNLLGTPAGWAPGRCL